MNILTSQPPETVDIGGRSVPIASGFREGIRFEMMALDENLTADHILANYFGADWPEPYDEAIRAAIWFYHCGEEQTEEKPEPESKKKLKNNRRSYDFEIDAEAIYTSFLQTYGIDLLAENLHWWIFRALLLGLPDETPFKQRVYYRIGSTKGMSAKQKKDFEERRKRYQLPERGAIDHKLSLLERDTAIKKYVADRFKEVNAKS